MRARKLGLGILSETLRSVDSTVQNVGRDDGVLDKQLLIKATSRCLVLVSDSPSCCATSLP